MNKKTTNLRDWLTVIVVLTFYHIFTVIFASFTMIGDPKDLSEFLEKASRPKRGYAEFVGKEKHNRNYYRIYNERGELEYGGSGGGIVSGFAPENYIGTKFICYYDWTNPVNYYICYDSIIYDSKPVYKTKGYIVKVAKPEEYYESIDLTICWKSKEGKWKLIEQPISVCEYEKYKAIKEKWEPIEISVFKTQGGFLAQVVD